MTKTIVRYLAALAFLACLNFPAKGGAIIEGDTGDGMLTKTQLNNQNYHNWEDLEVGGLYNGDNGNMVDAFPLPYLAPGQQVTGATISFYQEGHWYTPTTNVQLYGLNRVSLTDPTPLVSDWYVGANDTANTLLDATFATPSTPLNSAVTYSGSNLVNFVQKQYANAAFAGQDTSSTRYIFFRLSPSASQSGMNNYVFASARHRNRNFHPTLALTISNGISNIAGRLQFSFTLPTNATTSAGVYNTSTGALIRTLWNNVQFQAGTNYGVWDGKDSTGALVSTGANYQIKLIYHNVQYIWDGTIGNTSKAQSGLSAYTSISQPTSMAVGGNSVFYAVGYNEQQTPFHSFTVGNPQVSNLIGGTNSNVYAAITLVTADATRSYWAKTVGGVSASDTYIIAINNSDSSFYTFPKGTNMTNQVYASSMDFDSTAGQPNSATGIAVQKTGSYLFASHGNLNVVRVFDKVQGNLVGSFAVTDPGMVATTANGDVWVVANATTTPVLRRYTFANGTATLKTSITGLVQPLGVGCSSDDSVVVVADGGSSQQIKAFNNSTGAAAWTYGKLGGMNANGPDINGNTFMFGPSTYIAFQADNTFWVGDGLNRRIVHLAMNGSTVSYVETISYVNISYDCTVDLTDPTRVFDTWTEFSCNYSLPLGGTNGSWTMVKNWSAGLPTDVNHQYQGFRSGLGNVVTLSNGHTYALLANFATVKTDLIELSHTGPPA